MLGSRCQALLEELYMDSFKSLQPHYERDNKLIIPILQNNNFSHTASRRLSWSQAVWFQSPQATTLVKSDDLTKEFSSDRFKNNSTEVSLRNRLLKTYSYYPKGWDNSIYQTVTMSTFPLFPLRAQRWPCSYHLLDHHSPANGRQTQRVNSHAAFWEWRS